jgi:hypothetical protein
MTTPSLPPRQSPGASFRPIVENDLAGNGSGFDFDGDDLDAYYDDYEPGVGDRFRAFAGRALIRLGWLVLAAGLAFGSAGIVAAAEHAPSSGMRPELTWAADKALSTKLDAAVRELALLSQDVAALGTQARKTLSSLTQLNQIGLRAAWDAGWSNVISIDAEAADLNQKLECGAWDTTLQLELAKQYSPAIVARYHQVCVAVASVAPIRDDWQAMVAGSQTAIRVADDIDTHDSVATDALKSANQGRWVDALAKIGRASASISDATTIANNLSTVTDVSTLTTWLTRTTNWDNSASLLWQAMIDSKGVLNKQVTAALRGESEAKALLPNNTSVLQIVLYEVAGNLTSNGISIETARGNLTSALTELTGGSVLGG